MERALSVYALRIAAAATEPLELDEHAGSALRGALFRGLLRRFCMNPTAPTCGECALNATCPVGGMVAPLRDESPRGRDVPRPFVLAAEWDAHGTGTTGQTGGRRLAPGAELCFGLSLFGKAITYLPYVALSMPVIESLGVGRPLAVNGGRRGRFRVERIELVDPFGEERQGLYARGETRVAAPTLAVTGERVAARAEKLPCERLTIEFLTPTRLIAEGRLVQRPELRVVVARLAERLDALSREYGEGMERVSEGGLGEEVAEGARERARALVAQAEQVRLVADETRWVDVASYSARQRRATPIGGLVGRATYEGDVSGLREVLVWGELVHVGKNAVKGDGQYRIVG
jgi:hypothetical protein